MTFTTLASSIGLPPQSRTILKHLLDGKAITDLKCYQVYGIKRLSDCIFKIRNAGHEVSTKIKTDERGKKYAEYRLIPNG